MSFPLVSIVIATYNRGSIIERAIETVQLQDYPHKEIIIVNDGSTDNTAEILARYPDIHVITNKQNLRLQKSLNIGCHAARGKYIARLDDHDVWLDARKLSKQVALLESQPEVGVVGTAITLGNRTVINPLSDQSIRHQMLFRCPFSHVTVVFRKALFEQVGGYDENLKYSEDWDLWMKMGMKANLMNLAEITTLVEEASGSLTDKFYVSQLKQNRAMLAKYSRFYPRRFLAFYYQFFVGFLLKFIKRNSIVHRVFLGMYTKVFCR